MMTEYPPKSWFNATNEIISESLKGTYYEDFKRKIKLRPFGVDSSTEYFANIFKQLVDLNVIKVVDDRLRFVCLENIPWISDALLKGETEAWLLASKIENVLNKTFKFDASKLLEIGAEGEKFVLNELKLKIVNELHNRIQQISLIDDTVGYDIKSPSTKNSEKTELLEIKTSTRCNENYFEFFLSRNEYNVGLKNSNWSIVAVQIKNNQPSILGYIKVHQIESKMPKNVDSTATWESVRLRINHDIWNDYLP